MKLRSFFSFPTKKKIDRPYLSHKDENIREAYRWYASKVGYLDIILYATCLLFQKAEFIGAWLAFKILGRWESSKLEVGERRQSATKKRGVDTYAKVYF